MDRPAIFITGAAAGIGRATAELFASRGWFLGLYDLDETGLRILRDRFGEDNCIIGRLDTTDVAAYSAALAAFWERTGHRLDVLFNNAGIANVGDFEQIPLAQHHRLIDVNLKGVVNGCHLALPYLLKTPDARVISMCSASAIYGAPSLSMYSSTKFAVRGLTESLNVEWDRHGIRVMDIMPLFVNTPMVRQFENQPQSAKALGVRLTAEDIARVVWKAATRPLWATPVHWYPGLQTLLMHVLTKISPSFVNRFVVKKLSGS
ncbi:MAG: SDR family oxidoreductase [Nevskiaceae bacterium]|nr:MAG: SDR family oxidoreductase [Nevskiaceae bacterium]